MLRKQFILICLGAVVFSIAGLALAAAVKVALVPYDNPVIGIAEPDASGHAILNYAKGADKTEVQVNCWGLSQEGEYTVYLKPSGWLKIGTFTLRRNGSGNLHVFLEGDLSGATPVAVNNPDGFTVLMSE
jgi:hypothetical protein